MYFKAEGIFRINAENSQEEFVRDQLNSGIVPDGIDVHCLAGLIKVSFSSNHSVGCISFLINVKQLELLVIVLILTARISCQHQSENPHFTFY